MTRARMLSRRGALRASTVALGAPLLDALWVRGAAAQQAPYPKRFIVLFSPNGTVAPTWEPAGTETDFQLGPILAPLTPHRDDLVVVQGVDQQGGGGDGHQNGIGGMLTGAPLNPGRFAGGTGGTAGWASAISVDQRIAAAVGHDTRFRSLELGVQVGAPDNYGRMCYAGADEPLPPEDDPERVFARVFGDLARDPADLARLRAHKRSVLDRVAVRYERLAVRLGADDRHKLEAHLSALREIEARLALDPSARATCAVPSHDPSVVGRVRANDAFPAVSKLQIDLMVMALACDMTRVASLQWSRSVSQVRFSWLGISEAHHDLSHQSDENASAQDKLTRINRWYAEQLAYLIVALKAVPEGDGTLFDNALILWCNELATGNLHSRKDAPYVIAGRAGGAVKTGRYLRYAGDVPHNNLLLSLVNAMGIADRSFGKAEWCTGPLPQFA